MKITMTNYYNTDKLMSYNNPSFIEKMIQLFIKSTDEYLLNMNNALLDSNVKQINQLAHFIKPSVDLLSIHSITQSIRDIEQATELNSDLISKIEFTNHQLHIASQQMKNDYL
jgi:HPt (histidine-containing phosphotransfer) domain-containing protein